MTDAPRRIQLSRTKGWRMPPNTTVVARPTRWGNPFRLGDRDRCTGGIMLAFDAVERFTGALVLGKLPFTEADARRELRGRNLACWCPLDQPCHADVLLELANSTTPNPEPTP